MALCVLNSEQKESFMTQNHYNTIIIGAEQSDLTLPSPKGEGARRLNEV